MSFMSGIMMGAAIGRNIHEIIGGKKRWRSRANGMTMGKISKSSCCCKVHAKAEEFALVSKLSGRRRYRIQALVNNAALGALIEKKLKEDRKVSKVEINFLTGSLLIIHKKDDKAMDSLMVQIKSMIPVKKGKAPVIYATNWYNTTDSLNNRVRCLTRGWFDLSTLLSVIFLIRGIRKMLLLGQRPSGPTMVWWALHMMKGWKF
ncbi:MAG TPA: hypothetical protein DCR09_02005 [Anaerovibrio sp.]|uniref:HMA2 domain-containing protein n=1 Tax=Anaerovibrio lipolyticus TaxID=82374 RepID=UPI000E83788B|nr:hypothetical protein [Anaerovibrio lipolyticus]HAF32076.1 hypothetical protein [Anaerovibrio sp.]HAQ55138.1 hypothetical protein [Anaerovibrio sp.]HCP95212.1 hypothetical protein [Anaerovibrio sp.]